MAAGLGFKDFVTGEVLTAADVDGYLMQGVWVFASAAVRDATVTSPQEGNFAYLKDTNVTTYYTGSAWANLDTTGMTNPMTTTGDTIYSSSGSTPARLGIGSTGNVLTVSGGVPVWSAPASGGGMTLLSTTTLSGASTTISSIDQTYNNLQIVVSGVTNNTNNRYFRVAPNSSFNSSYCAIAAGAVTTSNSGSLVLNSDVLDLRTDANNIWVINYINYASATRYKPFYYYGRFLNSSSSISTTMGAGSFDDNTAITSWKIDAQGTDTFSGGTVQIYGVK